VACAIEKSIIGTSHMTINDQPEKLSSKTKPTFDPAKKKANAFDKPLVIIPMATNLLRLR